MVLELKRAEEIYAAELAKIRAMVRMRLGIVAGILIVAIFQTNFDDQPLVRALGPLAAVGVVGPLLVLALAARDKKRAWDVYDSSRLRVPTRKTGK